MTERSFGKPGIEVARERFRVAQSSVDTQIDEQLRSLRQALETIADSKESVDEPLFRRAWERLKESINVQIPPYVDSGISVMKSNSEFRIMLAHQALTKTADDLRSRVDLILSPVFESTSDSLSPCAGAAADAIRRLQREPPRPTNKVAPEQGRALTPAANSAQCDRRFRVALSFPGEHRDFVEAVAEILAATLTRDRVFYDKWYESELARPNLDIHLQHIYHHDSDLIAMFVCTAYDQKDWCRLEWRAIRDLIKNRRDSDVMPLRFDSAEIPGLFSTDGYVSLRDRSPEDAARLILERLQINAST